MKKILFLTLDLPNFQEATSGGGIYADLIRSLSQKGTDVYVLCQAIRGQKEGINTENGIITVRTKVPFLTKNTSLWKKGLGSLLMNWYYLSSYNKYLLDTKFDFIVLPTPPSTMVDIVRRIKKRTGAKLYVILRDIQPECADRKVDPSVLQREDVYDECKKSYSINFVARFLLYRKSQNLYKIADRIGCMSPGNIAFMKTIAPFVSDRQLVVLPNWYEYSMTNTDIDDSILETYNLTGKYIAIFGGNIGPQQAIWNIATLAKHYRHKSDIVFLVVGRGTKLRKLKELAIQDSLDNIKFINYLPSNEYNALLRKADVGIISLDEKYKVPTCPSKIIGYMALSKPVIAMFNEGSDYGDFYIDRPGCGLWSTGLDHNKMFENFDYLYNNPDERRIMGQAGYDYFIRHLSTEVITQSLIEQLMSIG